MTVFSSLSMFPSNGSDLGIFFPSCLKYIILCINGLITSGKQERVKEGEGKEAQEEVRESWRIV